MLGEVGFVQHLDFINIFFQASCSTSHWREQVLSKNSIKVLLLIVV